MKYEGNMIAGTVYFVKALHYKIGDITEADIEYLKVYVCNQSASFDW